MTFESESAESLLADMETKLPPMVAAKAQLEPEGKWDALRADIRSVYEKWNVSRTVTSVPSASTW